MAGPVTLQEAAKLRVVHCTEYLELICILVASTIFHGQLKQDHSLVASCPENVIDRRLGRRRKVPG